MKTSESKSIAKYFQLLKRIEMECEGKMVLEVTTLNKVLYGNPKVDYWEAAKKLIPYGLFENILARYPNLTVTEVKICCLYYINADVSVMSFVLNVKKETIYSTLSHIRRKLGIGALSSSQEALKKTLIDLIN